MLNALASDITVTWLAAVGGWLYFHFMWSRRESDPAARATFFLIGVLTVLLAVRGFFWLFGGAALGRVVFMAATLLPIAITLFSEHLLRRHHPLSVKLFALSVSVAFFFANLFVDLSSNFTLLIAFLCALVMVVALNVWLLLCATENELSRNELRLVRTVLAAAVLAVPLLATDFREEIAVIPVRLGAVGALLFVFVLVHVSDAQKVVRALMLRLLWVAVCAGVLASAVAFSVNGPGPDFAASALRGLPVTLAWLLLTAIFVRIQGLSAESSDNRFLRWLLHARLDSAASFLGSLRRLPQAAEHLVLGPEDLHGYALDLLFHSTQARRQPIALAEARIWACASDSLRVDAAEQLVDLLERHEMTHALLVSRDPALVVLLNFPQGAHAATSRLRIAVIQRLARHLAGTASHD